MPNFFVWVLYPTVCTGLGKLQPAGQIQPISCFCTNRFIETQPCSFVTYCPWQLSHDSGRHEYCNRNHLDQKRNYLLSCPLQKKFVGPRYIPFCTLSPPLPVLPYCTSISPCCYKRFINIFSYNGLIFHCMVRLVFLLLLNINVFPRPPNLFTLIRNVSVNILRCKLCLYFSMISLA